MSASPWWCPRIFSIVTFSSTALNLGCRLWSWNEEEEEEEEEGVREEEEGADRPNRRISVLSFSPADMSLVR